MAFCELPFKNKRHIIFINKNWGRGKNISIANTPYVPLLVESCFTMRENYAIN